MKVFLGGTCSGYDWRGDLIPLLKCDYYNPIVKNWSESDRLREVKERETSDYVLYVITSGMKGVYSIAEIIDDSHRRPEKTILCVLYDGIEKSMAHSLEAVVKLAKSNGVTVCDSLSGIAYYLNESLKKKTDLGHIKKNISHQLNAEDYGNRCESFAKTFFEEINTDDEAFHKRGYHMLKAILDNDIDAFCIAACGWSIKSLLVKAYLMKDAEVIFYNEPIEAEFVSIWDGGNECRTRCKINLQTFEVFDIECSKSSGKIFNELEEEYIEIEGLMFKVVPKDEAESIGNDIVFWYGESE